MPGPYGKILTGVGLMNPDDSTLTQKARDTYITEVGLLLLNGNKDGHGLPDVLGQLFPIPPIPGPSIPNITTLKNENLFWFEPDPFALLMIDTIKDPKKVPIYHKIFLDLMFQTTATAMNVEGGTPLFPILDWSFAIPDLPFPPTLPDFQLKLKIPTLTLPELALKFDIKFPPKLPALPNLPLPLDLPSLSLQLPIPPLILPKFCLELMLIPFKLVLKLAIPSIDLALNLPKLPELVFKLALDLMIQIMIDLDLLLITPKLLVASLLVYLKNIVGMVVTDIIGLIFGAGGTLTKTAAKLTGLV